MPKLNAPAEIHWRRSNMNTRDPFLMKFVEVLKDCRSLNAATEMNCPMPRSVEKVPIRNEKRCTCMGHRYHPNIHQRLYILHSPPVPIKYTKNTLHNSHTDRLFAYVAVAHTPRGSITRETQYH